MPRVLAPVPRRQPRRFSDGTRAMVAGIALSLFAVWFLVISEQAREVRTEMRALSARLDRFSARAAAFERDAVRLP